MPVLMLKQICGVPKYIQLAGVIRKDIIKGRLKAGDKLFSVRELADYYETTKVTVSQAMDQLAREGLIEQQQGRGNFVKRTRPMTAGIVFDQKIFDPGGTRYCACLLSELEAFFRKQEWGCKFYLNLSPSSLDEFGYALESGQFDGLVVDSRPMLQYYYDQTVAAGIKCVSVLPYPKIDHWVGFDYFEMAYKGTQELVRMGCRRIGSITGVHDFPDIHRPEDGYVRALTDHGLAVDPAIMRSVPFMEKEGFNAFNEIWNNFGQLDGLVVTDELIMRGVVRAIVSNEIKVPDQLKVASQVIKDCDHPFAIPVVELRCNVGDQAVLVGQLLIDRVEGNPIETPTKLLVPEVYNPYLM